MPSWLRAALVQAAWCWLAIALAFGCSRLVVGAASGLAPVPFAAYSVLIFIVLPAIPALVVTIAASAAQRMAPPGWVHMMIAALAVGGWALFATQRVIWGVVYAVAAALGAGAGLLARSRENAWVRAGVLLLGAIVLGAAWYGVEALG